MIDLVAAARDALSVRHVFGEPIERDGVTVIPAAVLRSGEGGADDERRQRGEGSGFGVVARPAGAYVIKDGEASWRPVVDLHRMIGLAAVGRVTIGRRGAGIRDRAT